jgi:hypothetical protein
MVSKKVDSFLRLEDSSGKELARDDDSGGFPDARILFECPETATYRVFATTFAGGTGGFTLKVAEKSSTVTELMLKDGAVEVKAELTNSDLKDPVRKGSACKIYSLKLSKGKTYQFDMISKKVDSFLRIEDSAGKELAHDDDGGGFPDAQIIFECPEDGTYRVFATTFAGGAGEFTLRVKEK